MTLFFEFLKIFDTPNRARFAPSPPPKLRPFPINYLRVLITKNKYFTFLFFNPSNFQNVPETTFFFSIFFSPLLNWRGYAARENRLIIIHNSRTFYTAKNSLIVGPLVPLPFITQFFLLFSLSAVWHYHFLLLPLGPTVSAPPPTKVSVTIWS